MGVQCGKQGVRARKELGSSKPLPCRSVAWLVALDLKTAGRRADQQKRSNSRRSCGIRGRLVGKVFEVGLCKERALWLLNHWTCSQSSLPVLLLQLRAAVAATAACYCTWLRGDGVGKEKGQYRLGLSRRGRGVPGTGTTREARTRLVVGAI